MELRQPSQKNASINIIRVFDIFQPKGSGDLFVNSNFHLFELASTAKVAYQ